MKKKYKFRASADIVSLNSNWFQLVDENDLTLELSKDTFPFIEQNMNVSAIIKIEYKPELPKSKNGGRKNGNGKLWDIEEHF